MEVLTGDKDLPCLIVRARMGKLLDGDIVSPLETSRFRPRRVVSSLVAAPSGEGFLEPGSGALG